MSIPSTFSQISQAFGFHFGNTLTVKVYDVRERQRPTSESQAKRHKANSRGQWNLPDLEYENYIIRSEFPQKARLLNSLNISGAFPLVGNVVGVMRAVQAYKNCKGDVNKDSKSFLVTQIVRGVLEALFLGIVLLLIDLIVTLGRYIVYKCTDFQIELSNPRLQLH